jgi:hypothetical protein
MTARTMRKLLRAKYEELNKQAQEFTLRVIYDDEVADAYNNQRLGALQMLRVIGESE